MNRAMIFLTAAIMVTGLPMAVHAQAPVDQQQSVAPVNVGNKICPVSGRVIGDSGMVPATYTYKGKVYNFCCAGCPSTFAADPEKYVKIVEDQLKQEQAANAKN